MSRVAAIRLSLLVGFILIGAGVISIRNSLSKTPENLQARVKQLSRGARLSFSKSEGSQVIGSLDSVSMFEPVRYDFSFTNIGVIDAKIELPEVIKGPLRVVDYSAVVSPSGEGKVTVEFDPTDLEGDQEGVVKMRSNDIVYPERELVLRLTVNDSQ